MPEKQESMLETCQRGEVMTTRKGTHKIIAHLQTQSSNARDQGGHFSFKEQFLLLYPLVEKSPREHNVHFTGQISKQFPIGDCDYKNKEKNLLALSKIFAQFQTYWSYRFSVEFISVLNQLECFFCLGLKELLSKAYIIASCNQLWSGL